MFNRVREAGLKDGKTWGRRGEGVVKEGGGKSGRGGGNKNM